MKPVHRKGDGRHLGWLLLRINLQALGLAMAVVAVIVIVSSAIININDTIDDHRINAAVLADNVSASLLFDDAGSAEELLQSLRSSPVVHAAAVYREDGEIFADYVREGYGGVPARTTVDGGVSLGFSAVEFNRDMIHQGRVIGQLYMRISLSVLHKILLWMSVVVLVGTLISIFLARTLLVRLTRSALKPVSDLTGIMARVSDDADYQVRAEPSDIVELDALAKVFNHMIEQIRTRDESLAAYRQHLEEEVSSRTAQLKQAMEEAEHASQAKSAFLSRMSHELRTPMNAILGFSQILEMDGSLTEEQRRDVREIVIAGTHLLELINEVLDLSRIESGSFYLNAGEINIHSVVEECVALVARLAAEREVSISNLVDEEVTLRTDRTRLKQCLLNLISNAIKYNRRGGSVVVATEAGADNSLLIRVSDTGIGIDKDRQEELFQPFNRLGAEDSEIEGTGIGLTITRRLLELLGGEVEAQSRPGVGSTFTMKLPLPSEVMRKDADRDTGAIQEPG